MTNTVPYPMPESHVCASCELGALHFAAAGSFGVLDLILDESERRMLCRRDIGGSTKGFRGCDRLRSLPEERHRSRHSIHCQLERNVKRSQP